MKRLTTGLVLCPVCSLPANAQGESHLVAMLRPLVLGKLGNYNHAPSVAKCQELFAKLTANVQ